MRLLECSSDGNFILTKDFIDGNEVTQYAILSHTWVEGEEVTFDDLNNGSGKDKLGYEKIRFCAEQARQDGLRYCWVDTCCINKANFTELSQAINSMFYWYHNATKCYVYLADVSTTEPDANDQSSGLPFETAFRASRWFTRGWTLQELLAPSSVEFFSRECKKLGDKVVLERQICEITGIPEQALRGTPLPSFGVDERMSWAKNRNTTYKEDEAYSLLGIFDIHMPLIYGEGRDNALSRLREEIDKPSKGTNPETSSGGQPQL